MKVTFQFEADVSLSADDEESVTVTGEASVEKETMRFAGYWATGAEVHDLYVEVYHWRTKERFDLALLPKGELERLYALASEAALEEAS